ncbi:12489_t:CDS:2, partial [Racocetra persica]
AKDTDKHEKKIEQIEDVNEDVEDDKQSCVIVECRMNKDEKKNKSNKTKVIVSMGSDEHLQTSNERKENLTLSSNQPARKIECTSRISNNLFLQTNKQIIEFENESDNSFARGQLQGQVTTCQTLLQTKFTQEELRSLLNRQNEL